ncbi:hypothetical protein [Vibrio sp. LaRot3]|uniref:hypothetical protein n=1 Tax=Vibrio sp. LaRot3 TaxID=2998829 RepID=UPI0022CE036A|nr:hypothetical protein [Vibrio sp. LaRot3]MDA0150376.1 hypothetical protein [Vibrio sp. LaRot3]
MFKNKHFIIALLVAPILSVIAYFGVDLAVSEKPHAAEKGQSYKLLSKSNCRYTSGLCDMVNGEFKVQFRAEKHTQDALELSLKSAFPLEGIKLSLVDSQDEQGTPINMQSRDESGTQWYVTLPAPSSEESWLRVAIKADGTLYYGDTQTLFTKYETLFTDN